MAAGKASLDAFLDQMTLGEALRLLAGRPGDPPYPHSTGAIGDFPKFGIPCVQTCDGPAGVRREGTATNFPCAALLAFIVLFNLITLPVEVDASRRALAEVERLNLLTDEELAGGKKVLFAAGMTYFISLVASIVQLLRLLSLANRRR